LSFERAIASFTTSHTILCSGAANADGEDAALDAELAAADGAAAVLVAAIPSRATFAIHPRMLATCLGPRYMSKTAPGEGWRFEKSARRIEKDCIANESK
jgi:hypothetical protein